MSTCKRWLSLLLTLVLMLNLLPAAAFATTAAEAVGIAIDANNFPDAGFRQHILDAVDDGDGILSQTEIDSTDRMWVYNTCENLIGLHYFPNLAILQCKSLGLTSLDVSGNPALYYLECDGNKLTTLNISNNPNLGQLYCENNRLTSLDVSASPYLDPSCWACTGCSYDIQLTDGTFNMYFLPGAFDPSKIISCTGGTIEGGILTPDAGATSVSYTYDCGETEYGSFVTTFTLNITDSTGGSEGGGEGGEVIVPNFDVLIGEGTFPDAYFRGYISAKIDTDADGKLTEEERNAVTEIDFSYDYNEIVDLTGLVWFPNLQYLYCNETGITSLDVSTNTSLKIISCNSCKSLSSLTLGYNNNLTQLDVDYTALTSLDVSSTPYLETLRCGNIATLTSLTLGSQNALEDLYCWYNALTELDVSGCPVLDTLKCNNNQLTELDLSNNTLLRTLECPNNQLTWLDLSKNAKLTRLNCEKNRITSLDVRGCGSFSTFRCSDQSYDIVVVDDAFDPTTLPGSFDPNMVYSVSSGATLENGVFQVDPTATSIRYTYNCNDSGRRVTFTLNVLYRITSDMVLPPNDGQVATTIDETSFPDAKFREYVTKNFDKNSDGVLTLFEAAIVSKIDVAAKGITDLTGIGYFGNLKTLICNGNNMLTSLDVSNNLNLEELNCNSCGLTSLNVRNNAKLKTMQLIDCDMTSLDLSGNPQLEKLVVSSMPLTSLDVSSNLQLTSLDCSYTDIVDLDLSSNTALKELHASVSGSLNISTLTGLEVLSCRTVPASGLDLSRHPMLRSINFGYSELASLDVSQNPLLESLNVRETNITQLDLSNNPLLASLDCSYTGVASLDLSNNPLLEYLDASHCQLTELKLSARDALNTLDVADNQLKVLDVSNYSALNTLDVAGNGLERLYVTGCGEITWFYASNNNLTTLDLTGCWDIRDLYVSGNQLTSLDTSPSSVTLVVMLGSDNRYRIAPENGQFDLSTLPGAFDVSRARNWVGGTVEGTILTVEPGVLEVTYEYDARNAETLEVALVVSDPPVINIPVDAATFPDNSFLLYVMFYYDTDDNGYLNYEEVKNATTLSYYADSFSEQFPGYAPIEDFTGIELLTFLEWVDINGSLATRLDFSNHKKLWQLNVADNQLATLNLVGANALKRLNCSNNQLTNLNVTTNSQLWDLKCANNQLKRLSLNGCTALMDLDCSGNQLSSIDIADKADMRTLNVSRNQFTSLNPDNNSLQNLYVNDNPLTSLTLSSCLRLSSLDCSNCQLTELDLSNCNMLTSLYAGHNRLTALDLTYNTSLRWLGLEYNRLLALDVSALTALTSLDVSNNCLAFLDVSSCPELTDIYDFKCENNAHPVTLDGRYCDFATQLPGFDGSKAIGWSGVTQYGADGVTFSEGIDAVTYTYNCGSSISYSFTLYDGSTHYCFNDNKVVDSAYLVSTAGCETGSVYRLSCSCGLANDPNLTFTLDDALGHDFEGGTWIITETTHQRTCSRCSTCTVVQQHTTNPLDRKHCEVCDYELPFVEIAPSISGSGTNADNTNITAPATGWVEGENTFAITNLLPCVVVISKDGGASWELVEKDELTASGATYTAELTAESEIKVVVKGDFSGDGKLSNVDVIQLKAAALGKTDPSALNAIVGDVIKDGKLKNTDVIRVKAAALGKIVLEW